MGIYLDTWPAKYPRLERDSVSFERKALALTHPTLEVSKSMKHTHGNNQEREKGRREKQGENMGTCLPLFKHIPLHPSRYKLLKSAILRCGRALSPLLSTVQLTESSGVTTSLRPLPQAPFSSDGATATRLGALGDTSDEIGASATCCSPALANGSRNRLQLRRVGVELAAVVAGDTGCGVLRAVSVLSAGLTGGSSVERTPLEGYFCTGTLRAVPVLRTGLTRGSSVE